MRNKIGTRILTLLLTASLIGCSGAAKIDSSSVTEENSNTHLEQAFTEVYDNSGENSSNNKPDTLVIDRTAEYVSAKDQTEEEFSMTEKELNSFSMMYYLAITAEKIRTSKNNRLILDEIYTALLNDINPGAIDDITQDHLENLRDIIKSYTNITVKRDRLQYIYNQNKAAAIRSAIPTPLSILSMTNSNDWKKMAISVVYTAVDSYTSYKNAKENADKEFLMSGWDLDDEEKATVEKNRDRAFDYMVDMVQKYDLDGKLTLNETTIATFAEICQISSIPERTHRLESEEKTYRLLGNYWLELASCYFESDKYEKCLACIDKYNALEIGIYRQDLNYVQVLPKAIVASQKVYSGDQYIARIEGYANAIIDNTPKNKDYWALRYFAAESYMDLFAKTNERDYLRKAYDIVYDNATILLKDQRALNETYLNDVQKAEVKEPDYSYMNEKEKKEAQKEYKDEQKRVNKYNKSLKEERKTELPALYEPLVLNCELLFGLADELQISDEEKTDIEGILQTESNGIFLTKPINDAYSFSKKENEYKATELTKKELIIPANLLSAGSTITATVFENGKEDVFDDCIVTKVEREDKDIDSFSAHISSKKMQKHKWASDSKVTVEIVYADAYDKAVSFNFFIDQKEDHWYGDKVVFKEE